MTGILESDNAFQNRQVRTCPVDFNPIEDLLLQERGQDDSRSDKMIPEVEAASSFEPKHHEHKGEGMTILGFLEVTRKSSIVV